MSRQEIERMLVAEGKLEGPVEAGSVPESGALSAWRRCDPGGIDATTVAGIEHAFAGSALLLHHRRWPEAARGDPVAMVATAVDVLRTHPAGTPAFDLAMSGLLLHASRGNPTAALLLAHGLATLAQRRPESGDLIDRAERWARRWPRRRPAPPARR